MDRNKNIMVAIMLGVILTMAVGYAVLQQRLNIFAKPSILIGHLRSINLLEIIL